MTESKTNKLAKASSWEGSPPFGDSTFYMPHGAIDSAYQAMGLNPEKLIIPKEYHSVLGLIYDFYKRGGIVSVVVNRLAELSVTSIRNGERKTTNDANNYYEAMLHGKPSRLMRYLFSAALEYYLSGMVLPRVDWVELPGRVVSDKLSPNRSYWFPVFDMYTPSLIHIEWVGWGEKGFYIKVPSKDVNLIRAGGSRIKAQQLRYNFWMEKYPGYVEQIKAGADMIEIKDADPILRKEISATPYPTPLLENILEALVYKQQLRRMDFAVASRVINAILLVQEGSDQYPLTEETRENLDELKNQILARSNNPRMMERLFILFSNHTTQLTWITPDVSAMLNQEKYQQVNDEITEGLGFAKILITGESRSSSSAEVSTWAIQPQMEQLRTMFTEWLTEIYTEAGRRNKFKNIPAPIFKPIRLQDVIKTAAIFQAAFAEGNVSRTSRDESIGLDFETELELMADEAELIKELPEIKPMPYTAQPGMQGAGSGTQPVTGRPVGSKNVPVNNRNSGTKPAGQKPTAQLKATAEILDDADVIELIDKIAKASGIVITKETIEEGDDA